MKMFYPFSNDRHLALAYGDVPRGALIDIDHGVLFITIVYPSGSGEPQSRTSFNEQLACDVGVFSGRLFGISYRGSARTSASPVPAVFDAVQVVHELARALRHLIEARPTSEANYIVARDGLELEKSAPPAWLIKAMSEVGRESQP